MKIKSGILLADPSGAMNQNNVMLIVCDLTDLPSMLLNFFLALMMKKAVPTHIVGHMCHNGFHGRVSCGLPAMHRKSSTTLTIFQVDTTACSYKVLQVVFWPK